MVSTKRNFQQHIAASGDDLFLDSFSVRIDAEVNFKRRVPERTKEEFLESVKEGFRETYLWMKENLERDVDG